jgi:hypothetical protein
MANVGATTKRTPQVETLGKGEPSEVDILMRRVLDGAPGALAAQQVVIGPAPPAGGPRDLNTATELLDRAALAFDVLIDRCQRLEQEIQHEAERARAKAAEQGDTVAQWQRLAAGLKVQAETMAQTTAALKERFEAAEARAAVAERRAAALERASAEALDHAALAEQRSIRLQGKVLEAFGQGSRAHPVLDALATRAGAP